MSGPLEIVGDDTAPVCEDGVCAVPVDAVPVDPAGPARGTDRHAGSADPA